MSQVRGSLQNLPAEGYEVDPPWQPDWDARYDRFRLFVQDGSSDWGLGRVIAPVNGSTSWTYSGWVDTYLCSNFTVYNNGTAPLWQNNVRDDVTIERYSPFSTVFDGVCTGWEADLDFQSFDEVIVISQHLNGNQARERFFFARKGGQYYGIVRWDNSVMQNGQWVVNNRTIGLKRLTRAQGLSFGGFYRRARMDRHLVSVPKVNAGDVNGDAYGDIQFVNGSGGMYAGLCDHTANIVGALDMQNPWGAALSSQQSWNKPLGVGDMNRDGNADVVFVNGNGGIYAGLCDSTGKIVGTPGVGNPWGAALSSQQSWNKPLGVGDVNADGYADYVFINGNGGIYAGLSSNDLANIGTYPVGNPWGGQFTSQQSWNKPLGVGDMNGDGYADYVFINGNGGIYAGLISAGGQTSILELTNPWPGVFTSQQDLMKPLAMTDINGDEYADIVVVNENGDIYAALCDGSDIFSVVPVNNPWGTDLSSQQSWNVSLQQGFGWGEWF